MTSAGPIVTTTSGEVLTRAGEAVAAARAAGNPDMPWIAVMDALSGLTKSLGDGVNVTRQ